MQPRDEAMSAHAESRSKPDPAIRAVLFDFGGVLAEEGFRIGLRAIARLNSLDPESGGAGKGGWLAHYPLG
jgi:hypothetical protein